MKKSKGKKIEHWTPLGIFGLFCTILITVIAVFPFIYMFLMSFTESRTLKLHLNEVDFTNLENFAYIFKNSGFLQAFINSVVVVIASCALNVVISCMAAYGFEKKLFSRPEIHFPDLYDLVDDSRAGYDDSAVCHYEKRGTSQYENRTCYHDDRGIFSIFGKAVYEWHPGRAD